MTDPDTAIGEGCVSVEATPGWTRVVCGSRAELWVVDPDRLSTGAEVLYGMVGGWLDGEKVDPGFPLHTETGTCAVLGAAADPCIRRAFFDPDNGDLVSAVSVKLLVADEYRLISCVAQLPREDGADLELTDSVAVSCGGGLGEFRPHE